MHKRIIRREAIRESLLFRSDLHLASTVHIDSQDFRQQRGCVLPVAKRVASQPAISQSDVKVAIWTKTYLTAFVVPVRLRHFQQDTFGGQIHLV